MNRDDDWPDPPTVEKRQPSWRRIANKTPRLAPEILARHGRVTTAAFMALGEVRSARSFLNTHHDGLGGRPLDIAGDSDVGLNAVRVALAAL